MTIVLMKASGYVVDIYLFFLLLLLIRPIKNLNFIKNCIKYENEKKNRKTMIYRWHFVMSKWYDLYSCDKWWKELIYVMNELYVRYKSSVNYERIINVYGHFHTLTINNQII